MRLDSLYKNVGLRSRRGAKKSDQEDDMHLDKYLEMYKNLIHKPPQLMGGELGDQHTPVSPTTHVGAAQTR